MISTIYHSYGNCLPDEIKTAVKKTVEGSLSAHGRVTFFFRADDIGVPSKNYEQMMALFLKYQTPLCLAMVPAWLTFQRWDAMGDVVEKGKNLFCWHMHGYRHRNHETEGKKQEFGPARSSRDLFHDLSRGYKRLQSIMGQRLTPVFTPPWNRCSIQTMTQLKTLGFKGISRSYGSMPPPPQGFRDFPVHVDLHTRKEKQPEKGWDALTREFTRGMDTSACGIMIHHMRMNDQAFLFLEYLLALLAGYKQIHILTYQDLISRSTGDLHNA